MTLVPSTTSHSGLENLPLIVSAKTLPSVSAVNLKDHGVPKEILAFLKSDFRARIDLLKNHPAQLHKQLHEKANPYFVELFNGLENLQTVLKKGHTLLVNNQNRKLPPRDYLPRLLYLLCSLKGFLLDDEPKENPVCIYTNQLISFLIPQTCSVLDKQCSDLVQIPVELEKTDRAATLICIKEKEEWVTSYTLQLRTKPQYSFVRIGPNRGYLFDLSLQPIDHPCISASFRVDVADNATLTQLTNYLKSPSSCSPASEISISSHFTYYLSHPKKSDEPNAFTFNAELKTNGAPVILPPNGLPDKLVNQCTEQVSAYLDTIKDEVFEQLKTDPTLTQSYYIPILTSETEIRAIEHEILAEIAKNPEEHIELIEWLVETQQITWTSDDLTTEETDEILVTPQKAVELLLKAHPKPENEAPCPSIDAKLIQEDNQRKLEIEKAAKVKISKPNNKDKNRKKKLEPKPAAPKAKSGKRIPLSNDERYTVRQVYQGHPMKGHDFNKFALNLLKRKEENLKLRRSGSHINTARQTLIRMHRNGRKDLAGQVSHQKSFLRELLSPSNS